MEIIYHSVCRKGTFNKSSPQSFCWWRLSLLSLPVPGSHDWMGRGWWAELPQGLKAFAELPVPSLCLHAQLFLGFPWVLQAPGWVLLTAHLEILFLCLMPHGEEFLQLSHLSYCPSVSHKGWKRILTVWLYRRTAPALCQALLLSDQDQHPAYSEVAGVSTAESNSASKEI